MNTSEKLIATEQRLGAHNYKPLDVVLTRGEGVYVWDTDGNRYLDCLSAYSAVNQGHCHPKILAAMVEQAGRLTLTSRALTVPFAARALRSLTVTSISGLTIA
ncbi:aminotransferase class III-fold pyridoxal phosphate-dependent enzyme, partial [Rhizobium ruizarguesonis]